MMTSWRRTLVCGVTAAAGLASLYGMPVVADERVESLLQRIEQLEARLQQLEAREGRIIERTIAQIGAAGMADNPETMGEAVPGAERAADSDEKADAPEFHLGGALRFNLFHRDFVASSESKYGESGLDVFRLNVDGRIDDILISAEYRHYSYMDTIHHGWLGYEFDDGSQLRFGIHQVPFGLLPYAAHNAWFGVPYYLGLADDYDMGVHYQRSDGPWRTDLAFYKNEELNDPSDTNRYSFDLVQVGAEQNEEINQINGRLAYTFGLDSGCEIELGASGQMSEIYNAASDDSGEHWAVASHIDSRCGRWNIQLQGIRYDYSPENPFGLTRDRVRVGAFGGSYDIAARADVLVFNLAYNFDSPWSRIDQITCYNDYSRLFKDMDDAEDSQINTLGCAIGSGPLFTYVDWIYANNMAFFGNGSMAAGGVDDWRSRLNLNVGFYW